jgi:hypothetical protein
MAKQRNLRQLLVVAKPLLKPTGTTSTSTSTFGTTIRATSCNSSIRKITTTTPTTTKQYLGGTTTIEDRRGMSTSTKEHWIGLPSNLIFHPKVTCSPVFGLRKVKGEDAEEETTTTAPKQPKQTKKQPGKEEFYDLLSLPKQYQPRRAIPLPQRLHVQVHQFYNDGGTIENKNDDDFEDDDDSSSNNKNDTQENDTILNKTNGSTNNNIVGSIQLPSDIFGKYPIRTDIIHRVVVYQRNKKRGKRNGGARTKTISEVSGSGKKMRQQKGTGMARCGHKRPPHWRGGAKAHGT